MKPEIRLRSFLRAAIVMLALFGLALPATAYDFVVNGIYYSKKSSNTVAVTYKDNKYNSYSGNVYIPSSVTYNSRTYSVTSIGYDAFYGCSGLTSVTIPNSVTTIDNSAFTGCSGLVGVTIPNSVTSIGKSAFSGCSGLASVTIGNSVSTIGESAFSGCSNLTSVMIGNSVTSIGNSAFYRCSGLTNVTIPNSVTTIDNGAFADCSGLTNVTIGNSVKSIGNSTFNRCSGLTSVTIPNSVTTIGSYAFNGCSGLTSVTIGNSVNSIGICAFADCIALKTLYFNAVNYYNSFSNRLDELQFKNTSIESILIGNGVQTIPNYFVNYGTELKSVAIPSSVTYIGYGAFAGCSGLTSLTIPNSVKYIMANAFVGCSGLTSVMVESGNSVYDSRNNCNAIIATADNRLILGCQNTIIPNSVTSIGDAAFSYCSGLTSVTIPNSVTSIGSYAFQQCTALTSVTIPNSVTSMGDWAFSYCSGIIKIDLPSSVREISQYAFYRCFELKEVNIASIPSMSYGAFEGCKKIEIIQIRSMNPPYMKSKSVFENDVYAKAVLLVPSGSIDNYKFTEWWKDFSEIRGFDDLSKVAYIGPTSVNLTPDITGGSNTYFDFYGEKIETLHMTGLDPNNIYDDVNYIIETPNNTTSTNFGFTTLELKMTAKAADMVTNRDARLMAETNMTDEETSCGFEWRRYDAPEEMPSTKVYCPVYGGVMAGTLKNMSENVYYKYRPFYKSSAGNEYYGDWVAFITADAGVEFEPVVYTYDAPAVTQTDATLQGVALRGSEEITEQGFEYWQASKNNTLTASNNVTRVTAKGERMSKTVSDLQPGTKYRFRAFVTAGGETTYGKEVEFVTLSSSLDVNLDGEVNIADVNSVIDLIMDNGSIGTGDVNGDGEINIADINTLIDAILSK